MVQDHATFERSELGTHLSELERLLLEQDSRVILLVAEGDGDVIGYAAVSFDYSLWRGGLRAFLDCLYVRPESRGMAVGKLLFAAAMAEAAELGSKLMDWETPDWNARAETFYLGLGAKKLSCSRFKIAVDHGRSFGPMTR
jgi:GNAT superfamily N-acetyltransferase